MANVSARHQISRPTAPSAEILVTVSAAPADGEVVAAAASVLGSATRLRYGRLRMLNGYGSELLALPVFLTTEFLNAAGFYVRNTDDSCTSLPVPTSASGLVFGAGNLSAGETTASINGAAGGNGTVVAGNAGFVLTRPGPGNNGYVDITIAAPSWLTYPWTGIIATNPAARATFGIYKSPSPLIYRRENY